MSAERPDRGGDAPWFEVGVGLVVVTGLYFALIDADWVLGLVSVTMLALLVDYVRVKRENRGLRSDSGEEG